MNAFETKGRGRLDPFSTEDKKLSSAKPPISGSFSFFPSLIFLSELLNKPPIGRCRNYVKHRNVTLSGNVRRNLTGHPSIVAAFIGKGTQEANIHSD